jgi:hypothetical protein
MVYIKIKREENGNGMEAAIIGNSFKEFSCRRY